MRISCNWSSEIVNSLVVVSVADFGGLPACFLFDHQIRPPRTAKRPTAIRSPFGLMRYLRFHHVAMPMATTPRGKITKLNQKMVDSFCVVSVSGRSSGSLGRIEIRSSSEDSQLIMLPSRSRLPSEREPRMLFCAHSEVPTTMNRPGAALLNVAATPRVSGPFFPFFGSIAPPGPTPVTATLSSVVPNSFETVVLSPDVISRDRTSG